MDKIEIELNLNSITDTLKNLAEGVKENRSAKLIDIEGKGISVTIACNKADHFLKDWDKSKFVDTAIFSMTLSGPTYRQTAIEEFNEVEDFEKDDEETEYQDANEADIAKIFEYDYAPKKAYYTRDGITNKTKAFEEYLDQQ